MKFKRTIFLTAVVVAMGLLLGAGAAQAATVICENEPEPCADGDTVIRIEDLEVTDSMGVTTVYRVDFDFNFAENVYGSNLVYDFTNQEDVSLAMEAVREALNTNVPIPLRAGDQNSDRFFIGAKTVGDEQYGWNLLALGSESFAKGWYECTSSCLYGVAALTENFRYVYAVFDDGSPKLFSPSGEIGFDKRPDFTWRSVENSRWYFLAVIDIEGNLVIFDWYDAEDAGCVSNEGNFSERGQTCLVPSPEYLEEGSYTWWVFNWIDFHSREENKWSDPLSFTVALPSPKTLTVEKAGEGTGTVISDPPGIDCGDTCSADFVSTSVTLTATPDDGSKLKGWTGCNNVDLISKECTVLMTEAKLVNVIFQESSPF